MSVKATLLCGDGWHIYRDLSDGQLHLHLESPQSLDFHASNRHVDFVLPYTVLKAITEAFSREFKID